MSLKIIIAPDSFKGSLSAQDVCISLEAGIRRVFPDAVIMSIPMADGGEGTVQALVDATGGRIIEEEVTGPCGDMARAFYGILGDGNTAVVEMAAASGLPLVPVERRNPMVTTTYGTGELIRKALDRGCRKLIAGIGGSATNDGGAGMAQALGVKLFDDAGNSIGFGGRELARLAEIDVSCIHHGVHQAEVVVACDVDNPLCGPSGASAVYGPQKGATSEMVKELDRALEHYAGIIERDLGKRVRNLPGAGAAGGLGAGLVAFLGATLRPGVDIVIDAVNFEQRVAGADLVITGEGKIDSQTTRGKTLAGVARVAKKFGLPVVAIGGSVPDEAQETQGVYALGVDAILPTARRPMSLEEAMAQARGLVADTAEGLARVLRLGGGMGSKLIA